MNLDTQPSSTSQAGRVLIADDQPDVVAALRLLLRGAGLETDSASSVQDVRDRLNVGDYDLLLMDLNYARDTTSGREGLELLAEVHARDRLLPIIVMTGWGSIETAVEAMRRGARTFVHKPWENVTLTATVKRELDEGVAQRRADASASRELEHAQSIQRALLPSPLPAIDGCEMAALWQPASAFGGDCYDVLRFSDTRFGLSIADVAGKGLPAAFLMSNLQASVRALATDEARPEDVTRQVNRALCRHTPLDRFVTFFYATLDTAEKRLFCCNAGHNPPILVHADGAVSRPSAGGMVLGVFDDAAYAQAEIALRSGDRLVLFTDGITEAEGTDGEEYGDDRLVETVIRHRHESAQRLLQAVFCDVNTRSGGTFRDDATLISVAVQ
ncbi:MAG TPA: SpoIIE family protein phosphatase [Vicinamibacterales bacterium]|nr:SpoIIE family protein phosphatase [Vicinamibacterales bacterium]